MSLSKEERDAGYRAIPQPTEHTAAILRRIAGGHLFVTLDHYGDPFYCYEDGTIIREPKGHPLTPGVFTRMVREGWLITVDGGSFLEGGPPQQYRARTVADGPLPRWVKP